MFKIFQYQVGETKHSDYINKDDEGQCGGRKKFGKFLILNKNGLKGKFIISSQLLFIIDYLKTASTYLNFFFLYRLCFFSISEMSQFM